MSHYTQLVPWYDVFMQSGYYDYDAYADDILNIFGTDRTLLELGMGSGIVAERLLQRAPTLKYSGVDLTTEMIDLARKRLSGLQNIYEQDIVNMKLPSTYEGIFCVGGIWYVVDDDGELFLCSHVTDLDEIHKSVQAVRQHLVNGCVLALGIQGPHHTREMPFGDGMTYKQIINGDKCAFEKSYLIMDQSDVVLCDMVLKYRLMGWRETLDLFQNHGLEYAGPSPNKKFHIFVVSG